MISLIDNPFWDEVAPHLVPDATTWLAPHFPKRHELVTRYAHAIPTPEDITWVTQAIDGRGLVEIGAAPATGPGSSPRPTST